jgi:hypothetical protein
MATKAKNKAIQAPKPQNKPAPIEHGMIEAIPATHKAAMTVLWEENATLQEKNARLTSEVADLEELVESLHAQTKALAHDLKAKDQQPKKRKEPTTMATTPVNLGDIVQFQPADPNAAPVAALVIAVHDDGTSDVRAFLGYCQGTQDVQNVDFSAAARVGKVSKLGAKPEDAEE